MKMYSFYPKIDNTNYTQKSENNQVSNSFQSEPFNSRFFSPILDPPGPVGAVFLLGCFPPNRTGLEKEDSKVETIRQFI